MPTIGPLFMLNVVGGGLLLIATLTAPRRWLAVVAAAGAGYEVITIAALLVATTRGLFGFVESSAAPLYRLSLGVESAGALVLILLAGTELSSRRVARSRRPVAVAPETSVPTGPVT
jgi:hypothetical protein